MLYDGSLLLMAVVRYWRWGNARGWWGSLRTVTRVLLREVKSYLCKRIRLEC
jgi:predicted membrane chloride channel (bestrophin family)